MKKWVVVLLGVCVLAAGAFFVFHPQWNKKAPVETSGEEADSLLKPGTYRAEYDQLDSHGWKGFLIMKVNDEGKIEDVTFDYKSAEGTLKTKDTAYNQQMKAVSGLGPGNYCPRFAKNLIIYQDPEQVDGITGATSSSRDFKELSKAAVAAAEAGSHETVYLKHPPEEEH